MLANNLKLSPGNLAAWHFKVEVACRKKGQSTRQNQSHAKQMAAPDWQKMSTEDETGFSTWVSG